MINIATRGMFSSCCGGGIAVPSGGAIPYRPMEAKKVKVTITKVEMVDITNKKDIHIKLLDT